MRISSILCFEYLPRISRCITFFPRYPRSGASGASARTGGQMGGYVILVSPIFYIASATFVENLQYNYGGIVTFAHLRHVECLMDKNAKYDIGILGVSADARASCRGGESGIL